MFTLMKRNRKFTEFLVMVHLCQECNMNYGFSLKVIFKELVYGSNKQSQSNIIITYLFVNLNYRDLRYLI
jgi:hypothetical protein